MVFIRIMEYSSLWVCLQTRVEERKKKENPESETAWTLGFIWYGTDRLIMETEE